MNDDKGRGRKKDEKEGRIRGGRKERERNEEEGRRRKTKEEEGRRFNVIIRMLLECYQNVIRCYLMLLVGSLFPCRSSTASRLQSSVELDDIAVSVWWSCWRGSSGFADHGHHTMNIGVVDPATTIATTTAATTTTKQYHQQQQQQQQQPRITEATTTTATANTASDDRSWWS